jgi:AraC-like DNA-binding protein
METYTGHASAASQLAATPAFPWIRHVIAMLALSDIALRCGFADQAHLCKHFRQATGLTPAAWRRASRTQDLSSSVP